ncbi:hypothetical protein PHMEG_00015334 [Phytophthora megakarya]|uniref:Reverse transcriptase RNase H-like domain-containing protein n=1 Tax=Phytophthora megakarya TaxID=4795 RepID=A0A225W207_9STRA|nr:hypothetical protein PHMEG_00015334 [Phytophthora megakarya]
MDFDPLKPATEQQHRLIHCTSGTFTGSQCNWRVKEKEAFPIVVACDKLDYLLLRPKPFRIYCDHRNLIHIFAPHESVKKHVKGKLLRWAMKLMNYRYVVEHVPGEHNVWVDMISRWARNHIPTLKRLRTTRAAPAADSQPVSALRPLDDDHFEWPTLDKLREAQARHSPPVDCVRTDDNLLV